MAQVSSAAKVRPPAVAGSFYPAAAARLQADVTALLAAVPDEEAGAAAAPAIKALVAPHAGYIYSGPVAAHAFARLRHATVPFRRVVVIGPAHYVPVRGIAVPRADRFATPLGEVALDREALAAIGDLACVIASDTPHAPEHALEVELPFLQTVLKSFTLVPLLVGDAAPLEVAEILGRLWEGSLVVVSSDLSHYLDHAAARRRDAATAAAIERGDWAALGADDACGYLPLAGLLVEAERQGLRAERLALCNSGDTAGPRDRVVGYGAWMFR